MITTPRSPFCCLMRRALARTSMIVRAGLSSMKTFADCRYPKASWARFQSASLRSPVRSFEESMRAVEARMRSASSWRLISKEKKSAGRFTTAPDVDEDPEREGRLAGRRARAHDRHANSLESLQDLVERPVPRFQAVELAAGLAALLEDVRLAQEEPLQRARPSRSRRSSPIALILRSASSIRPDDVVGRDVRLVDDLSGRPR